MTIESRFDIHKGDFSLTVDLTIPSQGISALFGPSGCGKTSLLRAIAGLDHYPGARLKVGETSWQDENYFLPPHKRPLGYVFQENGLFTHLDVEQNLQYGMKRVPESKRKVPLQQAIELLDIAHLLKRKPDKLSGGEKQRVAIARAVAVSPRLLLMDEPLAALDMARKQEILPYIESLTQTLNIPLIYVSHATDEVARLADHLVLMEQGAIKTSGPIAELLTRLDLSLSQDENAEALITANVAAHDDEFNLTYVDFEGGRFTVPQKLLSIGQAVRLRVLARDVSLTLEKQSGTSILNIFPATVDQIQARGNAQVTVRLLVGGFPILARITQKSASLLDIQPGRQVYAQVKSVALLP